MTQENLHSESPHETTGKFDESTVSSPWMQQMLSGQNLDLKSATGGWRGIIEALLPGVLFVVSYIVSEQNMMWPLILSGGSSVLFCVLRAIQRQNPAQAISGLLGVGISIVWALASGRAENYYATSLLVNAAYCLILVISVIRRYSLAAILAKFFLNLPKNWRKQPEFRLLYTRCTVVTWIWIAVFAIRLAVKLPLYFGSKVVALGTAQLVLGLPLFAVAVWLTWVLLRHLIAPVKDILQQEME